MTDYGVLIEDSVESDDYEFDDELAALVEEDEETRRRPAARRPVRTGQGAGYYRPRPSTRYVTQAQLQAALAKIGNDVKANATGIKTVGVRVDAVSADHKKQAEILKKEIVQRQKDMAKLKSSLQMSALLPMLTSKTVTVPAGSDIFGTATKEETKLVVAPSPMTALLPMLLSGDGFGGGSGDSSSMVFMALALSGSL